METHLAYETKQESLQDYHEQTPEAFMESLTIFDAYVPVTSEMAEQPEYKMLFDDREQEVAVGIRGSLEEFAASAAREGNSVTISNMFEQFDDLIRSGANNLDDDMRDELFLVATKMRYNMQVRLDSANSVPAGARSSEIISGSERKLSSGKSTRLGSLGIRLSASSWESFDTEGASSVEGDDGVAHQEEPKPTAPTSEKRNYASEAKRAVYNKTKGIRFDDLDPKEQKRIARDLAKELHPDVSDDNDQELYKEVSAIIHPTKPNKGQPYAEQSNTEAPPAAERTSEPDKEPNPLTRPELEAKPETPSEDEDRSRSDNVT